MKKFVSFIMFCALIYLGVYVYQNYPEEVESAVSAGVDKTLEVAEGLYDLYDDTASAEPLISETLKPMIEVEDITYPSEPTSVEDFEKVLLNMANNNLSELTLNYKASYKANFEDSDDIKTNVSTAFDEIVVEYVDLFSGTNKIGYSMAGDIFSSSLKITLSGKDGNESDVIGNQMYFEQECENINKSLHEEGVLKDGMSQREIARKLFTYVTTTLEYDTSLQTPSYTGFGAVKNSMAVCQGYTALYNYLLKLNGIDCFGQSGEVIESGTLHIWTVATLDNKKTYIDVTFGDPVPNRDGYSNYDYFDATAEFLSETRNGVE